MDLKMIGEKALCDMAKMLIEKGEPTKYLFIEASLKSIGYKDEKGTEILTLNALELGFDAIVPMIPNLKKMVYKRGIPNLILFFSADDTNFEIIKLDKYDPESQEEKKEEIKPA